MEIWQKRYPDIGFFLSFFPYKKQKLCKDLQSFILWLQKQNLAQIEVLYVIGLFGFSLPLDLKIWLSGKKERALVFVEDNLGAFANFCDEKMIQHPQIHFHYAQEDPIDALAEMFPTDRLAIFSKKSFDAMRLKRKSAALSALYSDLLYSHKIVENILANFHRLEGCFDARGSFEKVPAIICGAGPSLYKTIPALKEAKEKALIFAGGSAIPALTQQGIQPHFAMALDPNEEEFERLKQSYYFEGPFLFSSRLHRSVFCASNGPFGYLKSDTGGIIENYLEKELEISGDPIGPDLGLEAFSVTTLAVAYAYALGCNPIIFAGVDLAYTEGKRYVKGIRFTDKNTSDQGLLEERVIQKDIYGNEIETLLKWVMEKECISTFAKNHPERKWINSTQGGIGFDGIQNSLLSDILYHLPQRDLTGLIHQWIQCSPLQYKKDRLFPFLKQLTSSLHTCDSLCLSILQVLEKGKEERLALYQCDLKEEKAYIWLLEGIDIALSHILFRYYPHMDPTVAKRQREMAKYRELKRQIHKFKEILPQETLYV